MGTTVASHTFLSLKTNICQHKTLDAVVTVVQEVISVGLAWNKSLEQCPFVMMVHNPAVPMESNDLSLPIVVDHVFKA